MYLKAWRVAKALGKEGETVMTVASRFSFFLPWMQRELAKTFPSIMAQTRKATGYESVQTT